MHANQEYALHSFLQRHNQFALTQGQLSLEGQSALSLGGGGGAAAAAIGNGVPVLELLDFGAVCVDGGVATTGDPADNRVAPLGVTTDAEDVQDAGGGFFVLLVDCACFVGRGCLF